MKRLTTKLPGNIDYQIPNMQNLKYDEWQEKVFSCITKLGKIEDILEKYNINSFEQLESCLKNVPIIEKISKLDDDDMYTIIRTILWINPNCSVDPKYVKNLIDFSRKESRNN